MCNRHQQRLVILHSHPTSCNYAQISISASVNVYIKGEIPVMKMMIFLYNPKETTTEKQSKSMNLNSYIFHRNRNTIHSAHFFYFGTLNVKYQENIQK